ncbi:Cysteine desulfurase [Rubripirellula obstinata]|uniref:cysteine desulfurase n=2 Tax=Rubripirellula obstinata TaxID=406547 RepID=A0A5B1CIN9_9BACT|nr:Cysteine desulfurase [Rubripirellula obstinata]
MIYLDHHSTTPCDPLVVQAMLPWLTESFGNPHSSHAAGREAAEAINRSLDTIATCLGVPASSLVITSGATEANNLAIRGTCLHPRQKRRHIITAATEHPAVLDVVSDLGKQGFRISVLPVDSLGHIDLNQLADSIDDDTAIVSIMWANNEIGTVAPIKAIAKICHDQGTILHSDATQTLGRMPINVQDSDVDLVSFSAHKCYGPKGTGILVAGNGNRRVRLRPQIVGGGQQNQLRSGTMAPASIVAMATAVSGATTDVSDQAGRLNQLRDSLWFGLLDQIDGLTLHGPALDSADRLAGNLNFSVPLIEGEAWMAATPEVAFSTGSACSDVSDKPSHVLSAIGLSESAARQSVRFGIGRTNTPDEIQRAIELLAKSHARVSAAR